MTNKIRISMTVHDDNIQVFSYKPQVVYPFVGMVIADDTQALCSTVELDLGRQKGCGLD